jgi:hypothetical protein
MWVEFERARRSIARVRARLVAPSPESLRECAADLEGALEALREAAGRAGRGLEWSERRAVEFELGRLAAEARQANALLRQAAEYYLDWLEVWAAGRSSYGPEAGNGELWRRQEAGAAWEG